MFRSRKNAFRHVICREKLKPAALGSGGYIFLRFVNRGEVVKG